MPGGKYSRNFQLGLYAMLRASQRLLARASAYSAAQIADPYKSRAPIPGVFSIVAVSSAKGGVGKSTTAANLAVASVELGADVRRVVPLSAAGIVLGRPQKAKGFPELAPAFTALSAPLQA